MACRSLDHVPVVRRAAGARIRAVLEDALSSSGPHTVAEVAAYELVSRVRSVSMCPDLVTLAAALLERRSPAQRSSATDKHRRRQIINDLERRTDLPTQRRQQLIDLHRSGLCGATSAARRPATEVDGVP